MKLLFIDNIRPIFIELDEEYIGYLNIGPCVELTFLEGKFGKFLILTFLTVSYTHLTLPTICSV